MPKLLDIDPHGSIAQFDREALEHVMAGQQILAIADVVLPAVPRAGDALVVELSLGDGASLVGAHSIDGMQSLCVAEQRHHAGIDDELAAAVCGDVGRLTDVVPSQSRDLIEWGIWNEG